MVHKQASVHANKDYQILQREPGDQLSLKTEVVSSSASPGHLFKHSGYSKSWETSFSLQQYF